MLTRGWTQIVAGALAFTVAHLVEVAAWGWFNGQYRPWFTNSGRAVLFTVACIFITSVACHRGGRALASAARIGAGAWIAMVAIFVLGGDPGTIFPIVLVTGTVLVAAAAIGGAFAAAALSAK